MADHRKSVALLGAVLMASAMVYGCRGASSGVAARKPLAAPTGARAVPAGGVASDPALARGVLDAIYAGSVTGIAGALHPGFGRSLTDESARGASALLQAQFGDVRQLTFDRLETAGPGITQGVWRVEGGQGTYDMRIWIREEKVAGIEFRPSAENDWAPMPMMGIEYGRHARKPAGW